MSETTIRIRGPFGLRPQGPLWYEIQRVTEDARGVSRTLLGEARWPLKNARRVAAGWRTRLGLACPIVEEPSR